MERAKARIERFKAFLNGVSVEEYRELKEIERKEEEKQRREFARWKVQEKFRQKRLQARKQGMEGGGARSVYNWLGRRADAFEEKAPGFYGVHGTEKENKRGRR